LTEYYEVLNTLLPGLRSESTENKKTFDIFYEFRNFYKRVLPAIFYREISTTEWQNKFEIILSGISKDETDQELLLRGNAAVFKMTLSTLVTNALRAYRFGVSKGGRELIPAAIKPTIQLKFELIETENTADFYITDSGRGIEDERKEILTTLITAEKFYYTLDLGRAVTGWSGSGGGLFSASRVLRQYGGSIELTETRHLSDIEIKSQAKLFDEGGSGSQFAIRFKKANFG